MKTKIILALAIAITVALVTQPVSAASIHQIVMTENSNTSLTITYDGSAVAAFNFGQDAWDVLIFPATVMFRGGGTDWIEPENSSLANEVGFVVGGRFSSIFSDDSNIVFTTAPNGSTVTNVGTDSRDGGSISVTFNDVGDVAAVPETGSTFGLLFLSLIALLGASRLRSVKLA